jgi:WD40 repeat protein/tetratricopeptide (TPR) repeat protein
LSSSALSPDGRLIAVGGATIGAFAVRETDTGREIAQHHSAHATSVSAIAFSGDGAKLATADAAGTIKIWADARSITSESVALATLKGHVGAITTVRFSTDAKRLASGGEDRAARVWDLENLVGASQPLELERPSEMVRYSPDGLLIAVAGGSAVRLWDAATGRPVRELSAGDKSTLFSVAFSPTDHRLLAVGHGGPSGVSHVTLWDIDAGRELARLPGATDLPGFPLNETSGPVGALAFSPDGKYLAAGFGNKNALRPASSPGPLKVWEVATRRLIHRLDGHTGYCASLDFSRDGTLLVSASHDGTAIIWSTATWKRAQTVANLDRVSKTEIYGTFLEAAAFSPDASTLALASRAGNLHLWDVVTGSLLETLEGHSNAAIAVVFSPDGRTLASGSYDQTVRLWNVATRRELMQLDRKNLEPGVVRTLAFSLDGMQLAAGGGATAYWSAAPIVWNDPARAAEKLRLLLRSNADFRSRIRMFSEHLRLHEALEKLDASDVRVQAALAATQANRHASRQAWPEAALAFDRLLAADPTAPEAWLRTPGLLRLATALLHQDRPADAARLLQGGAARRTQDGLPAISRAKRVDDATGALFFALLAALEKRLSDDPRNAGLLELRAEVHRQETDFARQAADYTAAIDARAGEAAGAASVALRRLYRRRGDAYVGLRKWHEAIADYDHVITPETADADLLANRSRAHEALKHWDAAAADWSRAAAGSPEGATWLAAFARRLVAGGQGALADGFSEQAQALYERALVADPGDDRLAAELAQLLLDRREREDAAQWTVLKPTEMKTETDASLELQNDGSIFAHRQQPVSDDTYSLVFSTELNGIKRLRLDVLADSRLPHGGPGWGANGNFWLNEVTLEAAPAESPGRAKAIPLRNAWADFSQVVEFAGLLGAGNGDVRGAVDGKASTGWAIIPRFNQDHTAVFELAEEIGGGQALRLTVRLNHQSLNQNQNLGNLGRFRLSVGGVLADPARQHKRLTAAHLTDPWARLAAAYHVAGNQQAALRVVTQHPAATAGIGDLYAADHDWEQAIAAYRKALTDAPADSTSVLLKLAGAYQAAGRTREAMPHLAELSSANPLDSAFFLRVAALQAWFGQREEFAATRQRILSLAKGSLVLLTAQRAAMACSILPSPDKGDLETAQALGRQAVDLGKYGGGNLLALGMAEFRIGNDAAAEKALLAAEAASPNTTLVTGPSRFYRAMILFRQGKTTEARALARDAAATMRPLPADEQNPLTGNVTQDDLIPWLAYKEAKAMIHFDAPPAAPAPREGK